MFTSWFQFETQKQRKKREAKYFKKVYPLGEAQREWEQEILEKLFPQAKDRKLYHFHLLVLKEGLALSRHPEDEEDEEMSMEEVLLRWKSNPQVKALGEKVLVQLEKLALRQISFSSPEDFCTAEEILAEDASL